MEKAAAVYCILLLSFSNPQSHIGTLRTAVRRAWSKRYTAATTDRIPINTIKPAYDARSWLIGVSHIHPNAPAEVAIFAFTNCSDKVSIQPIVIVGNIPRERHAEAANIIPMRIDKPTSNPIFPRL